MVITAHCRSAAPASDIRIPSHDSCISDRHNLPRSYTRIVTAGWVNEGRNIEEFQCRMWVGAPRAGFQPATIRLTVECPTAEYLSSSCRLRPVHPRLGQHRHHKKILNGQGESPAMTDDEPPPFISNRKTRPASTRRRRVRVDHPERGADQVVDEIDFRAGQERAPRRITVTVHLIRYAVPSMARVN
jgi:hypothetical protein